MKLSELASQFRPFLEHLYNEGEPALKVLINTDATTKPFDRKDDFDPLEMDIHNISIARVTVNVVWNYQGKLQAVTYLDIHEVEDKCFPTGNSHESKDPLIIDYPEEFEEYIKGEDYSDQDAADLFEHIEKRAEECETSWHQAFKDHIN